MRAFIVLCIIAVASAQGGYNYQPSNAAPSYAAAPSGPAPSYAAPEAAQSVGSPSYAAPQAELEKEFYTYSADDNDFNEPAASDQVANSLKRNLRVVFIKGPENHGLEDAALGLARQASEQQTAIYVLNKQADIGDLANKLNSLGSNRNLKPEVHFVKYRTPEDAANAQHQIQQQYDSLPGASSIHNGGIAPALNFASQPSAPARDYSSAPSAPSGSYLPASIFRRTRF